MAIYNEKRRTNPDATLREAMIEAKGSWRAYKGTMSTIRVAVVKDLRKTAKTKPKGSVQRKETNKKANRLEIADAANALRGMRDEYS